MMGLLSIGSINSRGRGRSILKLRNRYTRLQLWVHTTRMDAFYLYMRGASSPRPEVSSCFFPFLGTE